MRVYICRYQVHILESGEKRILGVGAVFKDYKSYWMPGWRHNSVGYHADHGTIFDKENCIRGRDGDGNLTDFFSIFQISIMHYSPSTSVNNC